MKFHRRHVAPLVTAGTAFFILLLLAWAERAGWVEIDALSWLRPYPWHYREIVPVDLRGLFNNDAIGWSVNPEDGNFDFPDHPEHLAGSTFPGEELPLPGEIVRPRNAGDVRFLFPSSKAGALNNLICRGQTVGLPFGSYRELILLAASHGEVHQQGTVTVYYTRSHETETTSLRVPGWLEAPETGQEAAWTTSFYYKFLAEGQKVVRQEREAHIWLCRLPLRPDRRLMAVLLPDNEEIHIFAASLRVATREDRLDKYSRNIWEGYSRLKEIKPVDRRGLAKEMQRLQQAFEAAKKDCERTAPRETDWLETSVGFRNYQLENFLSGGASLDEGEFRTGIEELHSGIRKLREGQNPYAGRRGNLLRSYRSEIDGNLQPYSLGVPENYNPESKYPLAILLHGHEWYRPFQGHPALVGDGILFLSPHGRGSIDFMFLAEEDLLKVIEEVARDYSVDEDRITLTGSSMGGTGCWNLGVKYPHRFAAIAPKAGNTNRRVWEESWGWGSTSPPGHLEALPEPFQALCVFVADTLDPITYAGNLLNLPAYCLHGALDEIVPVGHARTMVEQLRRYGCPIIYREDPFAGHEGYARKLYDEQWNWMLKGKRQQRPERIRHKAWKLKYGRSYWVTIEQFGEPGKFAEVEAEAGEKTLAIKTRNVETLIIDWETSPYAGEMSRKGGHGRVSMDGQEIEHSGGGYFTRDPEGRWSSNDFSGGHPSNEALKGFSTSELCKRPYLEGPIEDVFTTPFLLVYGTPENDRKAAQVLQNEAYRFVRDWEKVFTAPCRIKPDSAVTEEDIAAYSLILYGHREQNEIYRRVSEQLPLSIDSRQVKLGEKIWEGPHLGMKFCFPNPLNPRRYLCVFAGTSWRATYGINNRFGNWFHWGAFDNRNWFDFVVFDERTNSPATALAVGFFDQRWRLSERHLCFGDSALREKSLPRVVPEHFMPPEDGKVYLSDLMPVQIDQHKGNVNSDRSFLGNPLRLGSHTFEKGLGVRAPSRVEYQLGERYKRFEAMIGIDLEGGEGTEVRRSNETLHFVVWGDGRKLFRSPPLKWDSVPLQVDASIEGVKRLALEIQGSSQRWHFGSAAWAEACVE